MLIQLILHSMARRFHPHIMLRLLLCLGLASCGGNWSSAPTPTAGNSLHIASPPFESFIQQLHTSLKSWVAELQEEDLIYMLLSQFNAQRTYDSLEARPLMSLDQAERVYAGYLKEAEKWNPNTIPYAHAYRKCLQEDLRRVLKATPEEKRKHLKDVKLMIKKVQGIQDGYRRSNLEPSLGDETYCQYLTMKRNLLEQAERAW